MKLIPTATTGKVLVPLATMIAAGAVAIGSGASFSSTTAHTATVTSGILHQTNTRDGATLAIGKLQPGDLAQTGNLTVTNDGNLDEAFALTPSNVTDTFIGGTLKLTITQALNDAAPTTVFSGDFSSLKTLTAPIVNETLKVNDVAVFTYSVALSSSAPDGDQNQSAGARFTYAATQAAGNVTNNGFAGASPSAAPTSVVTPTP